VAASVEREPVLRVLGPIELVGDSGRPGDAHSATLGSARLRRAMAVFAILAGTVVSADRLIDLIWASDPPATQDGALHTVVSRLRRRLAAAGLADRLLTRPPGYLLRLDPGDCDATVFIDLVERAGAQLAVDPAAADGLASAALDLWRGPAYAELADLDLAAVEAARLEECRATAVALRAEAALMLHRPDRALMLAEQEIAVDALREGPRRLELMALYRLGRQAEALAAYAAFRRVLNEEVGLEPSDALAELQQRILRQDASLLSPPVETASADAGAKTGGVSDAFDGTPLLAAGVPLIGRDADLDLLMDLMDRSRVVTVTGIGGVGKTQLAVAGAQRALRSGRVTRAWMVELAAVDDPAAVVDAVGTALRLVPMHGVAPGQRLARYLAPFTAVLVLDNCEHLVEAVTDLVVELVHGCPGLTVVATSQRPLRMLDEHVLPLDPLPVSADGITSAAAVQLFLERARRADARFDPDDDDLTAITQLCRRIDGLPLAIELAAARIRHATPQELLDRLTDRFSLLRSGNRLVPDRHAALRDVVSWSYRLLDASERDLFDRVSVFRGAFTAADAAPLIGQGEAAIADALAGLVDRSLLAPRRDPHHRSTVFVQLETLRAYGAEQLASAGLEAQTRSRHAHVMAALVDQGGQAVTGPDLGRWVRRVRARMDDLRTAQSWAAEHEPALALRILAGLVDWIEFDPTGELVDWADAATARFDPGRASQDGERPGGGENLISQTAVVMALAGAGERFTGNLDGAVRRARAALTLLNGKDDVQARFALYLLGEICLYRGHLAATLVFASRARTLAESAGDTLRARWCDMTEVLALAYSGQQQAALARAEALVGRADLTPITAAWAAYTLGEVLMEQDPPRAAARLEAAVRDARRLGDRFLTGVALLSLASVTARHRGPVAAVPVLDEVVQHWERLGNWTQRWTTFRTVADVLSRAGDAESAAILLGACRRASATQIYGPDAQRLAHVADRLGDRLGERRMTELVARGELLSPDEVVTHVRDALGRAGVQTGSSR
jgi:predicted ATPase/DNA-binding SARP family transcriptional activator